MALGDRDSAASAAAADKKQQAAEQDSDQGDLREQLREILQRCYELALSAALGGPLVCLVAWQAVLGPLCVVIYCFCAVDTDTESLMHLDSQAWLDQLVYKRAWSESPLSPSLRLGRAAGDLLDGVPPEQLYGNFYYPAASKRTPATSRPASGIRSPISNSRDHLQNASNGSNASSEIWWVHFPVQLIYAHDGSARGGGQILSEVSLFAIKRFEEDTQQKTRWRELCELAASFDAGASRASCSPGESLTLYVWPQGAADINAAGQVSGNLGFNGNGSTWMPVEWALASFTRGGETINRLQRFLPEDFEPPASGNEAKSWLLRSHFLFSVPVGPGQVHESPEAARRSFRQLFVEELRLLTEADKDLHTLPLRENGIKVYVRSSELTELETLGLLHEDFGLAFGIVGLVLLAKLMSHHSDHGAGSMFTSLVGLLLLFESVTLGFGLSYLIMGRNPSVVVSFAAFVVPWLGAELLLHSLSTGWAQSRALVAPAKASDQELKLCLRIFWLDGFITSGKGMLCSCCCFLSCLAGVVAPVTEAGLVLGLSMLLAWLLTSLLYPVALIAAEIWQRPRKNSVVTLQKSIDDEQPVELTLLDLPPYPLQEAEPAIKATEMKAEEAKAFLAKAEVRAKAPPGRFVAMLRNFIEKLAPYHLATLAAFALLQVVALAVVVATSTVDGAAPELFPSGSSEAAGRQLEARFAVEVPLAASPATQRPQLCGLPSLLSLAEQEKPCDDADVRCGAWSSMGLCSHDLARSRCRRSCGACSFCMLSMCQLSGEMMLPSRETPGIGRCECFQHDAKRVHNFNSTATVVGLEPEAWPLLHQTLARELFSSMENASSSAVVLRAPMVQEHWRSGRSLVWPVFTGDLGLRASGELLCFCGGARGGCATPENATKLGGFHYSLLQESTIITTTMPLQSKAAFHAPGGLNTSNTSNTSKTSNVALHASGGFSTSNTSNAYKVSNVLSTGTLLPIAFSGKSLELNIVFGLVPPDAGFLSLFSWASMPAEPWLFDDAFDAKDPWVQRSVMVMCYLPVSLRSSVQDVSEPGGPWLLAFEQFLLARGEEYPSRYFDARLAEFLQLAGAYHKDLLLENGKLKAMRLSFQLRQPMGGWYGDRDGLGAMKAEWDSYVALRNSESSVKASKAWHTSPAWEILATVEGMQFGIQWSMLVVALVGSTITAMLLNSTLLTTSVLLSTSFAVLLQAMLVCGPFQWKFGPTEAVGFILLTGYILQLQLSVALGYAVSPDLDPEKKPRDPKVEANPAMTAAGDRLRRVRYALHESSALVLWATASGILVGTVMFFPMGMFPLRSKIGAFLISSSLGGGMHALVFLPALLLCLGPTQLADSPCERVWQLFVPKEQLQSRQHKEAQKPSSLGLPRLEDEDEDLESRDKSPRALRRPLQEGHVGAATEASAAVAVGAVSSGVVGESDDALFLVSGSKQRPQSASSGSANRALALKGA